MADREKRKTSPPSGRNIQVNSPASFRLTHDISLDEFEDDDLSEITEITDECGMSLNCNGPDIKGHVRRGTNSMSGRAELGAVGQLQAEMLHLELIDGADGYRGDKESSKASAIAPLPVTKDPAAPVTMDTYRPKRPTTLNLFPIVPRTQTEYCKKRERERTLGDCFQINAVVSHLLIHSLPRQQPCLPLVIADRK